MTIKDYPAYFKAKKRRNELMELSKEELTDKEINELGQLIIDIQDFKNIIINFD